MGALVVCGALVVGLAVLIVLWEGPITSALARMEAHRNLQNARVLAVHRAAGNKWYPHEMANGTVRWYRVAHDHAVDL